MYVSATRGYWVLNIKFASICTKCSIKMNSVAWQKLSVKWMLDGHHHVLPLLSIGKLNTSIIASSPLHPCHSHIPHAHTDARTLTPLGRARARKRNKWISFDCYWTIDLIKSNCIFLHPSYHFIRCSFFPIAVFIFYAWKRSENRIQEEMNECVRLCMDTKWEKSIGWISRCPYCYHLLDAVSSKCSESDEHSHSHSHSHTFQFHASLECSRCWKFAHLFFVPCSIPLSLSPSLSCAHTNSTTFRQPHRSIIVWIN